MTIYAVYYVFIILFFYLSGHVVLRSHTANQINHDTPVVEPAYSGRKASSERFYVNICIIVLLTIVGLRSQYMGRDLPGYLNSYDIIGMRPWQWFTRFESFLNYEKGFVLWMKICHTISPKRQFFLFACAAISMYPFAKMFYTKSRNTLLSIIVLLGTPIFPMFFSALRQGISLGIIGIAYIKIQEKKPVHFLALVIFASLFHSSALIFLLAYPVYWVKLKKHTAIASAVFLPVLFVLRIPIFGLMTKLFYTNARPDYNDSSRYFIFLALIYIFCVIVRNRGNDHFGGLSNIFFVGCAIQSMGGVYSIVIRLALYYLLSMTLLIPELVKVLKEHQDRRLTAFIITVIYLAFIAFGLYSIRTTSWSMCYPYLFYWEV